MSQGCHLRVIYKALVLTGTLKHISDWNFHGMGKHFQIQSVYLFSQTSLRYFCVLTLPVIFVPILN